MKLSENKILITGGASGIGLGLTERFIKEGNTVIICGRRKDLLQQIVKKHPSVITKVCNLAVEAERVELYNWIQTEHSDLNVLVNNAGIQNWMNITDDDFYKRAENEVITNVLAPVHLTSMFLNLQSLNTIINVTSGLSFVPLTKVAVYSATKSFFHSFTLSLRHLLKTKNIEVIEMIPPGINTDLGGKGIHDTFPPVSDFIESIFRQLEEGKNELTFGYTEALANGNSEITDATFSRMNP